MLEVYVIFQEAYHSYSYHAYFQVVDSDVFLFIYVPLSCFN